MSESKRPETGQMMFGDDWTGFFVRGDDAVMVYAPAIRRLMEMLPEPTTESTVQEMFDRNALSGLAEMLEFCNEQVSRADPSVQRLKPFEECKR